MPDQRDPKPATVGKRSFWLHQFAEYVIGASLVATGVQSPTPMVPTLVGALIVVNVAVCDGPLGAFRRVSRRLHRLGDIGLLVVLVATSFVGGVDTGVRIIQLSVALVFAMVVLRTDYRAPVRRSRGGDADRDPSSERTAPSGSRADDVGRRAGRVAGTAAAKARDAARRRRDGR